MNTLITMNPIEAGVRQHMISVFKSAVCVCHIYTELKQVLRCLDLRYVYS